jgi:hypothetical protein
MEQYYGIQTGAAALKRATMVNKKYAMSNKRDNVDFGVMSYNDYRSPNFYNGPHSQADAVNKPTPVGMEDFDTKWKYGVQQYNRPEVSYNSSSYPEWDGEKPRLQQYIDNSYVDNLPSSERKRARNDWDIKHNYNGRNPNTQKLHRKGSANRDLMSIDRQRKPKK